MPDASQACLVANAVIPNTVQPVKVGATFIAALALAQVGAFLSFMPLLSILAPLKAEAIDAAHKTQLLAHFSFWGALMAAGTNIAAGALSDRTRSRFGRRRPWIAIGVAATVAGYLVIMQAADAIGFVAGALTFQLGLNLFFAPLVALMADRVPHGQKGAVAGYLGLAPPVGVIVGAALAATALPDERVRYAAIATLLVLAVTPLLLFAGERPTGQALLAIAPRSPETRPRTPLGRELLIAGGSRLLLQLPVSIVSLFTLFNLQDRGVAPPGQSPATFLPMLMIVASGVQIAVSLAGGHLSDHLGRRKPFVLAAGLLLAAATLAIAFVPTWPGAVAAFVLFGAGFGLYTTVDTALIAQVLPSAEDAGRDLGLLNLANVAPQLGAPALALWLLGDGGGYPILYAIAAVSAAAGGALVLGLRTVK
jgi:MFS family permease